MPALFTSVFTARTGASGPRTLSDGVESLAADADRLGVDQHKGDHAGHRSAVDPVVDRAALDEHVAGLQMDGRIVQLHVDLARDDDCIVDRIRAVIAWAGVGGELEKTKDGAVRQG